MLLYSRLNFYTYTGKDFYLQQRVQAIMFVLINVMLNL